VLDGNQVWPPRWIPSGRNVRRLTENLTAATGLRACRYAIAPGHPVWLNRDPIGEEGGINLYRFADNKPVSIIDALGLQAELPPGFNYYSPGAGEYGDWIPGSNFEDCELQSRERRDLRNLNSVRQDGPKLLGPVPFGKLIGGVIEGLHLLHLSHVMDESNKKREESQKVYDLDVWACEIVWGLGFRPPP
jgi:RHS repeat-associated protein